MAGERKSDKILFRRFRTRAEEHERLLAQAKCLEGFDCDTCIYKECLDILGFISCAKMHLKHVSREDLDRIKQCQRESNGSNSL